MPLILPETNTISATKKTTQVIKHDPSKPLPTEIMVVKAIEQRVDCVHQDEFGEFTEATIQLKTDKVPIPQKLQEAARVLARRPLDQLRPDELQPGESMRLTQVDVSVEQNEQPKMKLSGIRNNYHNAIRSAQKAALFQPFDGETRQMIASTIQNNVRQTALTEFKQQSGSTISDLTLNTAVPLSITSTTAAATYNYFNTWMNTPSTTIQVTIPSITYNDEILVNGTFGNINLELNEYNELVYTVTYDYADGIASNFRVVNDVRRKIPFSVRKRQALTYHPKPEEEKARRMLRDMLTEKEFRRYITNGFIMVKGESGHWYQVFNSAAEIVRVWKNGKMIGKLCIHTDYNVPRTDHVINMKLMIELDERSIWLGANQRMFTEPGLIDQATVEKYRRENVPANEDPMNPRYVAAGFFGNNGPVNIIANAG